MIGLIGLDHHWAPAEVRGRLSFTGERLDAALRALGGAPAVAEVALVSTCNRTEVYVATEDWETAQRAVECFLAQAHERGPEAPIAGVVETRPQPFPSAERGRSGPSEAALQGVAETVGRAVVDPAAPTALAEYLYAEEGTQAARHLFQVAAGLRSMVVGESQVLGQVKDALAAAEAAGSVGEELRALFTQAIKVGKRVRAETRISQTDLSLAAAAVRVADESLGSLQGKAALLIGAGRTSRLCAQLLRAAGVSRLVLANRSPQAANDLAAEVRAETVPLEDICETIAQVQLIVSATAAPHVVLSAATVACGLRGRRSPLVIMDLAIPADVEPATGLLPAVSLYTLDMLRGAAESAPREADVAEAEVVVEAGAHEWARARQVRQAVPGIAALRRHVDRSQQAELARTLAHLEHLSEADRQAVARFGQRLVDKMFHHLVARIRSLAEYDEVPPDVTMQVLARLFADPDAGEP
jgi:glutamyl-tRNA reductase